MTWQKEVYSAAQATSDLVNSVGTGLSFTKNPIALAGLGIYSFGLSFWSARSYQGPKIDETVLAARGEAPAQKRSDYVPLGKVGDLKNQGVSWLGQGGFTLNYLLQKTMNRYFLFSIIMELTSLSVSLPVFWSFFVINIMVKLLFDLSNEAYEANKEIAEKFQGHDAKPFYRNIFYPLSGEVVSKIFCGTGSADHALIEDLLPWLGYVPKPVIDYLIQNPGVGATVLIIASVCGAPLAVLLLVQTYYFEGSTTAEVLNKIAGRLKGTTEQYLPQRLTKLLQKTINLMAPLHGSSSAMPVFYLVKMLLENSPLKWPAAIVTTLLIFLGVSMGVYYSEVRKTKDELQSRTISIAEKNDSDEPTQEEKSPILSDEINLSINDKKDFENDHLPAKQGDHSSSQWWSINTVKETFQRVVGAFSNPKGQSKEDMQTSDEIETAILDLKL